MKKEIKKTNNNVYPTIKKFSLAMTIIAWVGLFLAAAGVVVMIALDGTTDLIKTIKKAMEYVIYVGGGAMVVAVFLSIGQMVLAKKVQNVTPKMTSKQSIAIFATGLACAIVGAILFVLQITKVLHFEKTVDNAIFYGSASLVGASFLLISITSTIILAQIKVKQPVKKGK